MSRHRISAAALLEVPPESGRTLDTNDAGFRGKALLEFETALTDCIP